MGASDILHQNYLQTRRLPLDGSESPNVWCLSVPKFKIYNLFITFHKLTQPYVMKEKNRNYKNQNIKYLKGKKIFECHLFIQTLKQIQNHSPFMPFKFNCVCRGDCEYWPSILYGALGSNWWWLSLYIVWLIVCRDICYKRITELSTSLGTWVLNTVFYTLFY